MAKKKIKKKEKKKENYFQQETELAWKYIKESKDYFGIVSGIFILLFLIGFSFPYLAPPELLNPLLEQVKTWVEELMKETAGKGFIEMWAFIFFNNTSIALISLFSGFLLGVIPIFLLISNGLVIGLISSIVTKEVGLFSLWRLLPHGIFEIPAIILSFALGIKFAGFILKKNFKKEFKILLKDSIRAFIFIIVPLLVLAAIIEAFLIVYIG